ncbi:MAG TPA: hypothetical protein VKV39_05400 [Candidatus Sulfotelmatobacter sp.]|nr:hypothetical protein [Candidatus Sulfotelmatobacter sp.]
MNRILRLVLSVTLTLASAAAVAQTDAQKAFNAIKNMPGTWEQKSPDGKTLQVVFRTVSNGSAVMSEIAVPGEDMISMIHMDGPNTLLLTHYCGAGNQPRMKASISPDGKTVSFNFMDGTNIEPADAGHMQRMVLTLIDDNHHTEEWTFLDHGNEHKELFDLRRKM